MTKQEFVASATALRKYWNWEYELAEGMGVNLEGSTAAGLADVVVDFLTKGTEDWGLDPLINMNWVVVWCSALPDQVGFGRMRQWIALNDAEDLYDFIVEMNGLGWPEEIENGRWLK